MKKCKATGNFVRGDIATFICDVCNFVAPSARGLTQHKTRGSNCQDRSMSALELSTTNVRSVLSESIMLLFLICFQFECSCGKKLSSSQALGSHKRACSALTSSSSAASSSSVLSTTSSSASLAAPVPSIPNISSDSSAMPPPSLPESLVCCDQLFGNRTALLSHQRSKRHKVISLISIKSLTLEGTHSYYVSSGLEGLLAVTTWSF